MKRFLFSLFLLALFIDVTAAPKTWVGLSGGIWSQGSNWSPLGVPASTDDVTINAFTGTIIVDAGSPIALNSITITGSSDVIFSCIITKNFRLSSTSPATPALLINAGSTLTLYASNAGTNNSSLDLTYGNGVIGSIYGTLIFSGISGATSGPKLITTRSPVVANMYGIATFYNGGIIRILPNADNTDASLSPVPTLVMKNGSIYENSKDGGSFPVGTWESNSLAKALGPGANPPSFNGATYGNLEWNCPSQNNFSLGSDLTFNNVNLINTNAATAKVLRIINSGVAVRTLTINGDLTISSSSILEITGAGTTAPGGGRLHLLGNLFNSGTILTTGVINTINEFELDGVSNQSITNIGMLSGLRLSFIMNNAAGATLLTPVTLPYKLTLTSGKIKTTSTNVLSMADNAPSPTGGSITSFVDGPMKKGGHDDTFTFPIGTGSIYTPATYYSASLTTSDTIRAEYVRGNPQTTYGTLYDPTNTPDHIDHISFVEYWKLQKITGGIVSHNITLTVTEYSFCKNLNTTFIASYHPSATLWQSCGTTFRNLTGTGGSQEFGTITTTGQSLVDSTFTLGTSDPFASNPLPITLISFNASKLSNTTSSINWELSACCSSAAKFEIQRAGTNKAFVSIATIGGSETNKLYDYTDNGLKNGINYYRLKMIDADGKISYSRIVAVMNGVNGLLLTSLMPTVVTNQSTLTVASSERQKLDLIVVDMQGKVLMRRNYTIDAGNTNIQLSLAAFSAGVYQLTGISAVGKTNTIRFIKQ